MNDQWYTSDAFIFGNENLKNTLTIETFFLCAKHPKFRGYTYNFSLYIGKDIYSFEHIPNGDHISMSVKVVVHLFQLLRREVVVDNCTCHYIWHNFFFKLVLLEGLRYKDTTFKLYSLRNLQQDSMKRNVIKLQPGHIQLFKDLHLLNLTNRS